jgi:hypothetical protein
MDDSQAITGIECLGVNTGDSWVSRAKRHPAT